MDVLLEECPHSIEFDAFIQHLESGLAVSNSFLPVMESPSAIEQSAAAFHSRVRCISEHPILVTDFVP